MKCRSVKYVEGLCDICHFAGVVIKDVRIKGESPGQDNLWGTLTYAVCITCRRTQIRGKFRYDKDGAHGG